MNKNPIFIEFYPHERGDCYKILNPWTKYRKEIHVLGPVSMGLEAARKRAEEVLIREMKKALKEPTQKEPIQ